MPSLLDDPQQEFLTEVAPTMESALGGAPVSSKPASSGVPQSDEMTVAKGLLGPELADRYGDVLGLRKETWKDFWRDAGNELGRRGNADRVKERVIDQYQTRMREERLAAQERDQEDRAKINSFVDLVGKMKDIPKGHRQGILKVGLEKLGMAASPEVAKLVADAENFGFDKALTPELIAMWQENPQEALAQITAAGGDPEALIAIMKGMEGLKIQRQDLQNKILEGDRKKGIEQRANAKRRAEFISKMASTKVTDEATGEARLLTPDEVLKLADAYFPEGDGEPTGIPQAPPEVAAEVDPEMSMLPDEAPAGIPQAAATGKLKKITGTARRVE